ncbi:MAG: DHA2 family efflux MFS transporter permease subunit [Anaerolineae bacterium]|nr:DHA2 family efflux MFS transporter permease subunit [Anaerolineae bacterium]
MSTSDNRQRLEFGVLLATILASSMAFLDGTALNPAQPIIQADLGMDASQTAWVANAYLLFLAALILVGGSLGDRFGRKRVYMTGIVIFSGASLVCGLSQSVGMLIAARAVQGIGGALMVPGSLAIIAVFFDGDQRGKAIGTWSTFTTLTTLLGPVIGGWLAGAGLWRLIFFLNLPLAVVALWALVKYVPETRDETAPPNLDYAGALLITLGLAGLTFGLSEAPNYGFAHPLILVTIIGGMIAAAAFIVVENRSAHPMMPLSLFKSPTFSGTNALTFFLYGALSAVPYFLSFNLIQVQGYPPLESGLVLLPLSIILTLVSRRMGAIADRMGPRLLLTIGPALAGVGFFLFALPGLTNGPSDYWTTYFPAALFLGIGMGITVAPLTTAVMGSAPANSSGVASGINNAVARTGGVLAIALLSSLALLRFGGLLDAQVASLNVPPAVQAHMQAEASKLADAKPPEDLPEETTAALSTAVKTSYVETFRLIALIGAAMAGLSALLAFVMISRKQPKPS